MQHNDLNIVLVITAMITGSAAGMLYDPVVWVAMLLAAIMGNARKHWLYLLPVALCVRLAIAWWTADYKRRIGIDRQYIVGHAIIGRG